MKLYPTKNKKRVIHALVLSLLLLVLPGCGVELAMLGAAASAASSGSAVYNRGKLNASWMASFDMVRSAGETAFHDLGLEVVKSKGDAEKGKWTIVAVNEDNQKATLKIDRKSEHLTEFQIDIGWFGKEPTARLMLKRMAIAIDLASNQAGTDEAVTPAPDALP